MKRELVKDFMTIGSHLINFKPDTDIYFVIKTLIQRSISGAPVVNDDGELVGVISEKDCLKVLMDMSMHELPAGQVESYMSKDVVGIDQNKSILDAAELFRKSHFRRFPVVDGKKLVGLITRRDLLRAIEGMTSRK